MPNLKTIHPITTIYDFVFDKLEREHINDISIVEAIELFVRKIN